MDKTNLKSIKRESVKNIFDVIAEGGDRSRSYIASKTGLSLMTVGKVVDNLISRSILLQSKEIKSAAGRKAGLVNLNADNYSVIFDLSSSVPSVSFIDVRLELADKLDYGFDPRLSYGENIKRFAAKTKKYIDSAFAERRLIGAGAILPGAYDSESDTIPYPRLPALAGAKIAEAVMPSFGDVVCAFEEDIRAAARSNISLVPDGSKKTVTYICFGDVIGSATLLGGNMLYGTTRRAGDIGSLYVGNDLTFEASIEKAVNPRDLLNPVAIVLNSIISLYDPDLLIIESNKYHFEGGFSDIIANEIRRLRGKNDVSLPPIIVSDSTMGHSRRGLAMYLRSEWIRRETT